MKTKTINAHVTGSGTAVIPSDQLFNVLVPPPLDKSAKNNFHDPSATDPSAPDKLPAAEYVPENTTPDASGVVWMFDGAASESVTLNPDPS